MTEPLEALLIRVRGEEKALEGANEEAVRQAIINPILTHLGWNMQDLHEVCPEFPIGGKRVDYCLKHQGCEQILIEAKKIGDNLEQREEQLLEYSFRRGVPVAVLTNGMEWWFYLPLKQGPWKERKFFAVDITKQEASSAAQHLKEFLSKGAVGDGSSVRRANEVLDDNVRLQKTREALPNVWAELLDQPDDLPNEFFDAICQRVESACGYQPKREQVVEYLLQVKDHLPSVTIPEKPRPPQASKADRVKDILKDGQWHSASELRKTLNVSSINANLYRLEEEGAVELRRSGKGNQVRLRHS
jgi:hypothetical protein